MHMRTVSKDQHYEYCEETLKDTIHSWKYRKQNGGSFPFDNFLVTEEGNKPNGDIPKDAKMETMSFAEAVAHYEAN